MSTQLASRAKFKSADRPDLPFCVVDNSISLRHTIGRMTQGDVLHDAPPWWDIVGSMRSRRGRRQADSGRVECALRSIEGASDGLSGRWVHGRAKVDSERVRFTAFLPPGTRIRNPFKARVDIEVLRASTSMEPIAASTWGVGPGCVGLTLVTPKGVVEAAVLRGQAKWMVDRLQSCGTPGA